MKLLINLALAMLSVYLGWGELVEDLALAMLRAASKYADDHCTTLLCHDTIYLMSAICLFLGWTLITGFLVQGIHNTIAVVARAIKVVLDLCSWRRLALVTASAILVGILCNGGEDFNVAIAVALNMICTGGAALARALSNRLVDACSAVYRSPPVLAALASLMSRYQQAATVVHIMRRVICASDYRTSMVLSAFCPVAPAPSSKALLAWLVPMVIALGSAIVIWRIIAALCREEETGLSLQHHSIQRHVTIIAPVPGGRFACVAATVNNLELTGGIVPEEVYQAIGDITQVHFQSGEALTLPFTHQVTLPADPDDEDPDTDDVFHVLVVVHSISLTEEAVVIRAAKTLALA